MIRIRAQETIGDATLFLGDLRDILEIPFFRQIKDAAIVMDPPYSSGGYQEAGKAAGSIGQFHVGLDGKKTQPKIIGDNLTTRGYKRLIRFVSQRVPAYEIYSFCDWRMWTETADAIGDGGYRVRNMLVWDKGWGGMGVKWRSQHELICWGARGSLDKGWHGGNVLQFSRSGNKHHPTEKPVPLLSELIKRAGYSLIVDPFMGSASTGVAALRMGCGFVGIEIDEKHFRKACERLEEANAQGQLFDPAEQRAQRDRVQEGLDLDDPNEEDPEPVEDQTGLAWGA